MNGQVVRWLRLALGVAALGAFVTLLHLGSEHLGGSTGRLIEENRSKGLEVYAYVYTEVGDVGDFLDDEEGRYGRKAKGMGRNRPVTIERKRGAREHGR